jgi:CheY-like chemotaxis protein
MAKILVVEDNAQNLKLTTIILQGQGHTVIPALDSHEAEGALAAEIPDLLILDMGLPEKDGYTFARELRARPDTARLPILALSAFAMPGDAEKALEAGCTEYLTKPIRRALLVERVASMLGVAGASANAGAATPTGGTPDPATPLAPAAPSATAKVDPAGDPPSPGEGRP